MKYSKEFRKIIERKIESGKYVKELVSIEEVSWSKDQNSIFVRTIALQKDGSHCGHGIGIYFNNRKGNFMLLADGERTYEPFEDVYKEIRNVLPITSDIFAMYGHIDDFKSRLDNEVEAHNMSKEKIKYLEAKLFIKEYEEEISKKAEKSLPF
jgi:hypothetical protein